MSVRGRWALLLGLGVLLLVVGACANNNGSDDDPAAPAATATGTATDGEQGGGGALPSDTPSDAAGGSMLNCGEEQQGQGGTGYDREARECLWQAYQAGGGAVFTTTRPTVEGDPIVWHIELIASDRIEVTIDNTADRFAAPEDRKVSTVTCTSMAITDEGQNDLAFEISGCDGGSGSTLIV